MDIKLKLKELSDLQFQTKKNSNKFKELLASITCAEDAKLNNLIDFVYSCMDETNYRMDLLSREMYSYIDEHQKGHLPNISMPSKLQKAIKALGLEDDYEVQPRIIYASDKYGEAAILSYAKKV